MKDIKINVVLDLELDEDEKEELKELVKEVGIKKTKQKLKEFFLAELDADDDLEIKITKVSLRDYV